MDEGYGIYSVAMFQKKSTCYAGAFLLAFAP